MLKKILAAGLLVIFANAAMAASSKYELNLQSDGPKPVYISSVVIQIADSVAAETEMYDERDVKMLSEVLRGKVERGLKQKGLINSDGAQLLVTITDLKPNRPTMARFRSQPGIDAQSISLGGASMEGSLVSASGVEVGSFEFTWEENWIDQAKGASTWYDARRAFDRFSRRLARDLVAPAQS